MNTSELGFWSRQGGKAAVAVWLLLAFSSGPALAEIIWSGGFESGNFRQWHIRTSTDEVNFHQVPSYGRPIQYGGQNTLHIGDGSLLSLVSLDGRTISGVNYPSGPVRGGAYSAKFSVKNSLNGAEPKDCDNSVCTRRRTELAVQDTLSDYYNAMPYMSERWIAYSVFLPADWDRSGSGWGPVIFQVKPRNEAGSAGVSAMLDFSIQSGGTWRINHRWSSISNPTMDQIPWQQQMFYAGNEGGAPYPRDSNWPDGLKDFPDVRASYAALQSVRRGGWTDWVVHLKFDARGADSGGTGFMSVWKREDAGSWVQVLDIRPKQTTRGGVTFNHGIGYNSPAGTNNGGFGVKAGMYMEKEQVWSLASNRVLYLANVKVGGQNTRFSDMSHDRSSPGAETAQPRSPDSLTIQ